MPFATSDRRPLAGTSTLFSGLRGTGKTMAAKVIGRTLELDVYRTNLPEVVSKWVGETEKNLSRMFAHAQHSKALLLFDEADALLGKCT